MHHCALANDGSDLSSLLDSIRVRLDMSSAVDASNTLAVVILKPSCNLINVILERDNALALRSTEIFINVLSSPRIRLGGSLALLTAGLSILIHALSTPVRERALLAAA